PVGRPGRAPHRPGRGPRPLVRGLPLARLSRRRGAVARSGRVTAQREVLMDRTVIEQYEAGGPKLRRAGAGLAQQEVTARPGPGKWSSLELVTHRVDSNYIATDRMKRMLIEDTPPLLYADETAYNDKLFPHEQSLEYALTLFELGRRQFARVLRNLPPKAFER